MKVAMMGSGGIGGYFGARMAQAGADVSFIARGAHLDAMRKHGLRIDSPEMGDAHIAPVQATDDPAEVGAVDYVIMGVKLWDTEAAGHAIAPMLGPETTVLSLQNGVEGDDILASIVGEERLIAGVAFIGSAISAPGVIGHVGTMQRIVIGEREGGISPRIEALRDMLQKGGVMAEASEDIQRMLWEKFVFLVGLSSTTTLMRTTLGPVRENPESREFYLNVMRETVTVGRARGVNLPEDFADDRLAFSDGLPAEMNSSMHHDLQKGNRLELPWLAGTVVRYGRELGVPTPVCQTVYAALLPLADGS
ncbi:MAG: 2-dehydropantoate 2-reductase [Alphaproteobacteria bacterium]